MTFSKVFISLLAILTAGFGLAESRPFVVVSHERPPFHFMNANGKVEGICIDVLDIIFSELDITYEVINPPWARSWEMIKSGEVDAALSISRKEARERYLIYPKTDMWVSEFVIFTNEQNRSSADGSLESVMLSGKTLGIERGASYFKKLWATFPYKNGSAVYEPSNHNYHHKFWDSPDIPSLFMMLSKNRIGFAIEDRIVGRYIAKYSGLEGIESYAIPLHKKGYPMPFVVNSDYPNMKSVSEQFDSKLFQLKTTRKYQDIVNKWIQ